MSRFRVRVLSLNLRSRPEVVPSTRLAVLSEGQVVERLAEADEPDWWRIAARVDGSRVEGFVAHRFLEPASEPVPTPSTLEVPAVHLEKTEPISPVSARVVLPFPSASRTVRPK